jgi:cell division protein FtsI/penicillin-binding protein 2
MSAFNPLSGSTLNGERIRFQVIVYLVVAVFVILLLRLWFLQLIRGETYRNLSERGGSFTIVMVRFSWTTAQHLIWR